MKYALIFLVFIGIALATDLYSENATVNPEDTNQIGKSKSIWERIWDAIKNSFNFGEKSNATDYGQTTVSVTEKIMTPEDVQSERDRCYKLINEKVNGLETDYTVFRNVQYEPWKTDRDSERAREISENINKYRETAAEIKKMIQKEMEYETNEIQKNHLEMQLKKVKDLDYDMRSVYIISDK